MFIAFFKVPYDLKYPVSNPSRIPLRHTTSNIEIVFSTILHLKIPCRNNILGNGLRQDSHLGKVDFTPSSGWTRCFSTSSASRGAHVHSAAGHAWDLRTYAEVPSARWNNGNILYKAWPTGTWHGRGYFTPFPIGCTENAPPTTVRFPALHLFSD